MESHVLSRIFEFNGVRLPDPNPKAFSGGSPHPVRAPVSRHRDGIDHRAGGGRRQAALSVHASHRLQGVTHEPKSQKEGGDEACGPGGT